MRLVLAQNFKFMFKPNFYLLVVMLMCLLACCKKQTLPEPSASLKYNSALGDYDASSDYKSAAPAGSVNKLIPNAYTSPSRFANGDSFGLFFQSSLTDNSGKPVAEMTIVKVFHRSKMDFSRDSIFPALKDPKDFYEVFKPGTLGIACFDEGRNEGLNFVFANNADRWVFQNNASLGVQLPVPAYLDTANYFVITDVKPDLNFMVLQQLSIVPTGNSGSLVEFRAVEVTIEFKCKLYGETSPHNTLQLSNGVYKGLFVELVQH